LLGIWIGEKKGLNSGVRPAKAGIFSGEENLARVKVEPCNLGSSMAGNQDTEAYRQPYLQGKGEKLGHNESEHRGGLENCYMVAWTFTSL